MDVDNVSARYGEWIDRQKQTLLEAKKRQGHRPHDRTSREYAYCKFMMSHTSSTSSSKIEQAPQMHSSFMPPAYLPCITPMARLKPIAIKDLQLEVHHRGTFLLLRSITPPNRMTAIMALMEDENRDVILLQLYQHEDENKRAAVDIVNIGTVLLVKEPYFKVMGDGEYGLRADHLSDVIQLKREDGRIPQAWQPPRREMEHSAESLKIKGNLLMKECRYWDAIAEYSDALSHSPTANQIEIIKRNRSLAFLKTQQFDAALSDTCFPDFNSNPAEKALFRAAEALYNLERFNECCQVLEQLCTNFPLNCQAPELLERAIIRSREQKTGVYDFKQLQAEAKESRPPHLDHATYVGPVEIRQTESKGRGLFVTQDVKAGDLLLCEKAFSHGHVDEDPGAGPGREGSSKIKLLMNPETGEAVFGAQADLITCIVQKLYHNPSVAPAFIALYHGAYKGVSTAMIDAQPVVDTFLVERIISFNAFGCPVSSLTSHTEECTQDSSSANETTKKMAHHSCGIWVYASYINHNCISNVRRSFIGDMMIVRASRDIKAGTETSFWYHPPKEPHVEDLHKSWGFTCECALCLDARATSAAVLGKRRGLRNDVEQVVKLPGPRRFETRKIERLLEAMTQTYKHPAATIPRLLLWEPYLVLTQIYFAQNKTDKSLASSIKVLTSLGFIIAGADSSLSNTRFAIIKWGLMTDQLVETFLLLRTAFMIIGGSGAGAMEDAARAEEYAKTTYKVVVGEVESFHYLCIA